MKQKMTLALTATLLASTAFAQAQQQPATIVMQEHRVVTQIVNGKSVEKLVPSNGTVTPGTILQYTARVTNNTKGPLSNLGINNAVPKGTVFISSGVNGANNIATQFSIDAGKTFGAAPLFKTVIVNGKSQRVQVNPSEYQAVRWNIAKLDAGKTQDLVLRVRIR